MTKRLLLLVLLVTGLSALPARADVTCTQDLLTCYENAAGKDGWLSMWAAGMDCELGYAGCVRRAIFD